MSEWWTYRLSDFLMFSPRTYWRLVELYNRDLWPAQLLALAAGAAALALAASSRPVARRGAAALLAAAWLWVGWAFHWQRYATINWAAQYLGLAFAVQAVLLAGWCAWPQRAPVRPAAPAARSLGWVLAAGGVLLYPAAGLLAGRPWTQAEVFGIAPDPTALATLGLALVTGPPARIGRWMFAAIPVLALIAGAATHWAMAG